MDATPFRDDDFPDEEFDEIVVRRSGDGALYFISLILAFTVVWGLNIAVHDATAECAAVGESVERLACYDKFAKRSAAEPAKGALAPALDGAKGSLSHVQVPSIQGG